MRRLQKMVGYFREADVPGRTAVRWDFHPWQIAGALALVALEAFLIGGLLGQRSRRRQVERAARLSEAALSSSNAQIRDLAGQLIFAQEVERTRIARDLHDDACQEVASITVDVSNLRQKDATLQDPDVQQALLSVQRRMARVAEGLRLLSHDLHPNLLKHAGLAAALEAHCTEVERQYHIQVRFHAEGQVEPANPVVMLSLFRIAQEALRNAAKHGHAQQIDLSLSEQGDGLTLSVTDDGWGFDPGGVRNNGGLGLVSIEERARLVKGQVTIHSGPQQGTTISVRVPLETGALYEARVSATCA
jgi:two-component system sensor histidine kinase UhpB